MARVLETTVYTFNELSDEAKERARDWYRGCIDSDDLANDGDDWRTIAGILGVTFDTHSVRLMGGGIRYDDTIYWSLDPSECAFAGSYVYAKGAPKAIRAHAPNDRELHRIADELQTLQRGAFYQLTAVCSTGGRNGMSQNVAAQRADDKDATYQQESALEDLMSDFAHWIVRQIDANRDWLYADEQVDESILANGYEFDESGAIA